MSSDFLFCLLTLESFKQVPMAGAKNTQSNHIGHIRADVISSVVATTGSVSIDKNSTSYKLYDSFESF